MRRLGWFGAAVGLAAAQTTIMPAWSIFGCVPDVILVTVILTAVYGAGEAALPFALAMGYFRDLYSGSVVGSSSLILFLIVAFIRFQRHVLDFDSYLLDLVVGAGTIMDALALYFLAGVSNPWPLAWSHLLGLVMARAAYNIFVAEIFRLFWKAFQEWRIARRKPAPRFRGA